MKKRKIARSKIWLELNGTFENVAKCKAMGIKQMVTVLVLLTFALPVNSQVKADEKIKPGKRQATLILSDGRKIVLNTSNDTIVNSATTGVRIKIDSLGINYFTTDSIVKLKLQKNKSEKKK